MVSLSWPLRSDRTTTLKFWASKHRAHSFRMFIVNAPFIFSAIWAIVKGFIDEKTRKKINIMGGKY